MAIENQKNCEMTCNGDVEKAAVLLGQSIGVIHSIDKVKEISKSIVENAERGLKEASSFII